MTFGGTGPGIPEGTSDQLLLGYGTQMRLSEESWINIRIPL